MTKYKMNVLIIDMATGLSLPKHVFRRAGAQYIMPPYPDVINLPEVIFYGNS